ncbi:GntR family transcriptional regulator [Kocuria sp. NBRC 114282]|uniref:GntR family transcriptional regulator n=1 Tax=Kocuria sp. NBRC 114282 TaxID=2994520 RepID=UPI0024A26FD8|nr:GntR family transcriptional regulator [Kocuria sp. NBRC 114282]
MNNRAARWERTVGSSTILNAYPEASLPPAALNPVVQESTPALIARQLRRAIGEGELAPGQQLNEAALSRSLGVSRGPLREAMQRLTQEGLLVSVRNRGVFVIEVTDDDVRDMYLARTALERAAAAHAAETDPAAAQEQLLRIVQEMEDAAGRGDLVAVTEADIDFHTTLVSLAHSPRLTRMHTTLMVETRMCITALEQRYSSQSPRLQEHRHIAEAIGRADLAGLDRLLVGHMEDAIGRLVAALD